MNMAGTVLFAFTKIGTYAVAPPEEMYFLVSDNLLTGAVLTRFEPDFDPILTPFLTLREPHFNAD
jgi:hypothetical protein